MRFTGYIVGRSRLCQNNCFVWLSIRYCAPRYRCPLPFRDWLLRYRCLIVPSQTRLMHILAPLHLGFCALGNTLPGWPTHCRLSLGDGRVASYSSSVLWGRQKSIVVHQPQRDALVRGFHLHFNAALLQLLDHWLVVLGLSSDCSPDQMIVL